MRSYGPKILLLVSLLLGMPGAALAACNQTLSPGANVASAVSAAAAGTTICLAAGSYGTVNLTNIVKASPVVIQSASANSASIRPNINGANRLTFQNLTLTGLTIQGSTTKNISVLDSTFTGQAVLRMDGNSNANILIDGNTFDNISVCSNCYEGRLQVQSGSNPVGVTISNNHFGGPGESDGIQIGAPGVVIGPGNVFDGIVQGNYGRHVDAIQGYGQSYTTITGNYFIHNTVQIMMPDGGDGEIITNNVFIGNDVNYGEIQLGSQRNLTFTHNTVYGMAVGVNKKSDLPNPSSNAIVRDNLFLKRSRLDVNCSSCTFSNNMFDLSSSSYGANALVAQPTFVGGTKPTTWSGWQLTATSAGSRSATDGQDMGSTYFGPGTEPPSFPVAPTNLRVQ